jgi:hypothetical protein
MGDPLMAVLEGSLEHHQELDKGVPADGRPRSGRQAALLAEERRIRAGASLLRTA